MEETNNHNDPLENLFRKKAQEYDISYREEDWQRLEKQLDIRAMQIIQRKRIRFIAAAAVLIISFLGYFTIENHNRINELTRQLSESDETITQTGPDSAGSDVFAGRAEPEDEEDGLIQVPPEADTDIDRGARLAGLQSITGFDDQTAHDGLWSGAEVMEAVAFEQPVLTRKQVPADMFIGSPEELSLSPAEDREIIGKYISSGLAMGTDHRSDSERSAPYTASIAAAEIDGPTYSGFSISVAASPDFSTTGSVSNFYDPGYKVGVMGEYRLNSNLSLQGGLFASRVQYIASGTQYNPPDYWNRGVVPDETTAICMILDIPVNIKYSFLNFEKSSLYATAGFSSYIMLNEDYRFSYESNDPDLEQSWSGATGSRHWFSNAGFSIGYELEVHSNWSLRAEPFIRFPLEGVGWGHVDLYSMGSMVSLNYNFTE